MADGAELRGDAGIGDEELARELLDRRVLTTDRLLLARRHAHEQSVDLMRALRDLHIVTTEDLSRAVEQRETRRVAEAVSLDDEGEDEDDDGERAAEGEAEADAEGEADTPTRDLRAELLAIAETAVPSDLIEQLLIRALLARATDVHLDPREGFYHVRFRIDGRLHPMVDIDAEAGQAMVRGIKILSQMNLVEYRHPQDGAMTIRHDDRTHNLRASTLPTARGEKVVLRILEPIARRFNLDRLGMDLQQLALVHQFLARPYGAVLVGGPVGAGKTTTLYSALDRVNHPSRNVITIEDPVEYRFPGVNQVEINTAIGLSFAAGLRAILRQDPDVLMIGEIRDEETAEIGIRAALTGVLVFSTIHASDAAGTVGTLFNYGIPGFTLSNALQGVINQRLVRTICPGCRVPYDADSTVLKALKLDPQQHAGLTLYRGAGCSDCFHSGYRGRIGIFEIMDITDLIRELILMQTTKEVIRQVARDEGMITLRQAAIAKVIAGETTVEEMYRVTL